MGSGEKKDSGKKSGKGKTPVKTAPPTADDDDEAGAARRVVLLRRKLTRAMEDPQTRDQIVRAIRDVMKEN